MARYIKILHSVSDAAADAAGTSLQLPALFLLSRNHRDFNSIP